VAREIKNRYNDYYEYRTLSVEQYERRRKKREFNNEWIVYEVKLDTVSIRRAIPQEVRK
jgi:hypothetical protein